MSTNITAQPQEGGHLPSHPLQTFLTLGRILFPEVGSGVSSTGLIYIQDPQGPDSS